MDTRRKTKLLVGFLTVSMGLAACGITAQEQEAPDLPTKAEAYTVKDITYTDTAEEGIADFGIRLLSASAAPGENMLISPFSVSAALGMTMNGADRETLAEMENVLGMGPEELSQWFVGHREAWEESGELLLANSLWVNENRDYRPDPDFIKVNEDSYGAEIFLEPFTGKTAKRINGWVKKHTDGMIPKILKEDVPDALMDEASMYLVNALSFEAEWPAPYEEHQVRDGTFTTGAGEERMVSFLHSTEHLYLETEKAVGFLKPYKGQRYAFGALLPIEGSSLEELILSLDGEILTRLVTEPSEEEVITAVPKFETASQAELRDILSAMGMPLAFEEGEADFSKIAGPEHPMYISRVLHKTFLSLGEEGTRAGAATAVEMKTESCAEFAEPPHEVILDRPFLYFIVDRETGTPVFLGTMNDPT